MMSVDIGYRPKNTELQPSVTDWPFSWFSVYLTWIAQEYSVALMEQWNKVTGHTVLNITRVYRCVPHIVSHYFPSMWECACVCVCIIYICQSPAIYLCLCQGMIKPPDNIIILLAQMARPNGGLIASKEILPRTFFSTWHST